jgi:hypothetical protein
MRQILRLQHQLLWPRPLAKMVLLLSRLPMQRPLVAPSQLPAQPLASPFRHRQVCRVASAVVRFRLLQARVQPLQVAQADPVLAADPLVQVLVVVPVARADQIVADLPVLQAPLVPQARPVLQGAPQVLVPIIFPAVRAEAISPVPRYRVLVYRVQPQVAVDLVVPVVVVLVAVAAVGLVLSSAKADQSVVRRLKS